jgi:hypothetical protein
MLIVAQPARIERSAALDEIAAPFPEIMRGRYRRRTSKSPAASKTGPLDGSLRAWLENLKRTAEQRSGGASGGESP